MGLYRTLSTIISIISVSVILFVAWALYALAMNV